MKNIKNIGFIFILGIGFFSCSDLLDEKQTGAYSSATFYQTEIHAQIALTAVYNSLTFGSTQNKFWVIGDVASDDATKGGGAGDQSEITFIEQFDYDRSNGVLDGIWTAYYEGITRANNVIYYVPAIEMDESVKNKIIAEAKVLRAYFYFNLVNTFGEIPLKTNPPLNQGEINLPKSSVEDIYQQIERDLTEAIDVLETNTGEVGRMSKGSALGLLAKAHLYQEHWSDVETTIASIDDLGIYKLELVYKNNFIDSTQNNNESLFEIQHLSGQTINQGSYLNQYFAATKDNGYAFNVPLQNFVDQFEQTGSGIYDPRLDYTVGRLGQNWINGTAFNPSWSQTGYLQKKHLQPTKEAAIIGDGGLNYVYIRYADILLMKAEALNEQGKSAEALIPLNSIRVRARESYLYDVDLPTSGAVPLDLLPDVVNTNQSDVRDAIRHERRVELGFEFHRFFDLMRYGSQVAETALSGTNFNYEENRYFLIPLSEIDNNPSINE
jgi:starch-binding outer membrane protein, SusD/RagB family